MYLVELLEQLVEKIGDKMYDLVNQILVWS